MDGGGLRIAGDGERTYLSTYYRKTINLAPVHGEDSQVVVSLVAALCAGHGMTRCSLLTRCMRAVDAGTYTCF